MTDPVSRPPLDGSQVHVWHSAPETVGGDRAAVYASLLDDTELARLERFRFDRDRHTFLVAHALVRLALSLYEDRDPETWRFVTNDHGRPEPDPDLGSALRFNLSHTRGVVACGIAIDRQIGVDVERAPSPTTVDELASHAFSSREYEELYGLPERERLRRFLEIWTLKEAYIKARGLGLAIPLDAFSMEVGAPITIRFEASVEDDARNWQFEQQWMSVDRSLAVAIPRRDADLEIVLLDAGTGII